MHQHKQAELIPPTPSVLRTQYSVLDPVLDPALHPPCPPAIR